MHVYKMTREQIWHAKTSQPCKKCGYYGHWFGDHIADGSLNNEAFSSVTAISDHHSPSPVCKEKLGTVIKNLQVLSHLTTLVLLTQQAIVLAGSTWPFLIVPQSFCSSIESLAPYFAAVNVDLQH